MAEYEGQGQKPAGSPGGIETSGLVAAASPIGEEIVRDGLANKSSHVSRQAIMKSKQLIKSRLLSLSPLQLLRRHWPLIRGLSKLVQLSSPNDCDSTVGLCWHGTETSGLH